MRDALVLSQASNDWSAGFSARAFALMAMVADGFTRFSASDVEFVIIPARFARGAV